MSTVQKFERPETRRIAIAASLAAVASIISFVGVTIPFPLLPFLQFDVAEVPDVLSFFILGPSGGLAVTLIHWMILNLHGSFDPVIGPTMKFMAVFATMLGLYLGTFLAAGRLKGRSPFLALLGAGTAVRFLVMLAPTFLLYYFISPNLYLTFAEKSLALVGIHVSGTLAAAVVVTLLTGIFNLAHAVFTVSLSWGLYKVIRRAGVLRQDWLRSRLG